MKCWQKLLPVLGTGSVRFPVHAFVRFLFVCANKKRSPKILSRILGLHRKCIIFAV